MLIPVTEITTGCIKFSLKLVYVSSAEKMVKQIKVKAKEIPTPLIILKKTFQ